MGVFDSLGGGMFASAGSTFLNTMAGQHGSTLGARILRPYQDFDTPWGKGPYWNNETIPKVQYANTEAEMRARLDVAKERGIHPLFALGGSANFSGGPIRAGMPGPRGGVGGSVGVARSVTHAELLESEARRNKDNAVADYYRSLASKGRQTTGGDPYAGFGGENIVAPAKTFPLPPSTEVHRRALVETPRKSVPQYIEVVDEKGRRRMVTNPEWDVAGSGNVAPALEKVFRDFFVEPNDTPQFREMMRRVQRFLDYTLKGRKPFWEK